MPITLNHSNIGVQYSTGSNYIIETVKSDLYRRNEIYDNIVRDNIQAAPVTPIISIQDGSNVYAVESYTYSGSANTADFTRVFTKSTTCDILIVGGGGGGSAGGGGGGGYVYNTGISLNGTYAIKTGKGGAGATGSTNGNQGANSSIIGGAISYTAYGGGGGGGNGVIAPAHTTGQVGSYGGNGHDFTTAQTYTSTQGNRGGRAIANSGGGGGGSGAIGNDGSVVVSGLFSQVGTTAYYRGGQGGIGLTNNITGSVIYYAGGGTAGVNTNRDKDTSAHEIVLGGGGFGARGNNENGGNGTDGIGGGGGGGDWERTAGTIGGSGIVIIRYLLGTIPTTNLLTAEPTVSFPTFTESVRTFIHSGGTEAQTTHTITVGQNTTCDILIVGGGGGGDREIGGGGGGGAVLYATNISIQAGTYQIKVGKGGDQNVNGSSSEAFGATCLGGGSTAWVAWSNGNNGTSGGSGSGGSSKSPSTAPGTTIGGGIGTSTKGTLLASGTLYNGNVGGNSLTAEVYHAGGGGGGAGTAGNNSIATGLTKNTTRQSWIDSGYPQKGGDGVPINITGTTYYWGAGGGGGSYDTHGGDGGLGGGGGGGASYQLAGLAGTGGINNGGNGVGQRTGAAPWEVGGFGAPNTGSGGGGGGYHSTASGGAGGSGIVIIKFKSTTAILDGITHKRLNFAFDSLGYSFDATKSVEYQAQLKTGVGGWRIVRYLPPNLGRWYQGDYINTSTFTIPTIGTPYNYTNEWAVSFGTFDEMIFGTFGMTYWLRCLKTSVLGTYDNTMRPIISSSFSSTPYSAIWYNRTSTPIDPVISIQNYPTQIVYIENNYADSLYMNLVSIDGGMCVLVRDSATGATIPNPNLYTVNFPVPTLADINNNSNIILRGAYDIALSTSNALIIPKEGQHIHNPSVLIRDSSERIYPPVRNFTAATTTISGQPYGNGTYIVSASTFFDTSGQTDFNIFNGTNSGWTQSTNKYDGTGGTYSGLLSLGGFTGEWIKVQFPVSIKLTRYIIEASAAGGVNRAPSIYKIFGSNNNIDWEQVVYKSVPLVSSNYISSKYEEKVSSNNYYRFFALVIGKIIGGDSWLSIGEWYIYGQEFSNNSLSIRYNILNPILDPIGAQWTYSSSNTNVYHMGSVGIGTTRPEYQLDVRGAIYSSVGGYTQTGLTTWTVTSDKRIKDNIVRASYDKCLENVKNIELYNFNFKNNCVNTNDKHQLGFIAQEVQQVYPKAVEVGKIILNTNEAIDDILTLNTTQIDYTLYGAVKNLIEKIEDIDNDLESIEKAVGEPLANAGN